MWVCKKCNEKIGDNFDSCWNCTEESDITKELPDEPKFFDGFKKENRYQELVDEIEKLYNLKRGESSLGSGLYDIRIEYLKNQLKKEFGG